MTNDRVGTCARAYTTTSDDDCRRYQGVFGPPEYYTQHDTMYRGRRRRGKAHRCTQLQLNPNTWEEASAAEETQDTAAAAAAAAADDDDDDDDDDGDCACR